MAKLDDVSGDILFDIARGEVAGYSMLYKYGQAAGVDSDADVPIWDLTAAYPYRTSGIAMYISGLAETGNYVFEGVDSDYNAIKGYATATASGESAATKVELLDSDGGTLLWYRIFRGWNDGDTDMAGNIYVSDTAATVDSDGIPGAGESYAVIQPQHQQTMMCVYTVPANHILYLFHIGAAITAETPAGTVAAQGADISFRTRLPGKVFRTKESTTVITTGASAIDFVFPPRQGLTEGTDIEMYVENATGTVSLDGRFWGVLRDLTIAP